MMTFLVNNLSKTLLWVLLVSGTKKRGSSFLFFRPLEPDYFQTWLKHGSSHEPDYLRLNWLIWLKRGSSKTNQKEKHGSWLTP